MSKPIMFAALLAIASPASAEIVESEHGGFLVSHTETVAADRAAVWNELVHPERWWHHTWSDDSANLRLEAFAGGCFCETIPASEGFPSGSVEHARVVAVLPGSLLRMSGGLGPLQAEGLVGTLTVTLADASEGTTITWEYITGGHARFDPAQVAPAVDRVNGEFLGQLVVRLDGAS